MSRPPQVALLLETSTEYGRGLLRGIQKYSRLHGPWVLQVAPGHLDQALPKAKSWSGAGIIARIRSTEMERMIRASGLPCVASSLMGSWTPMAGANIGEIRTRPEEVSGMGATHLLETGLRYLAFCGFLNCRWSTLREKAFVQLARDAGYSCSTHHIDMANWIQRPGWIANWEQEEPVLVKWLRSLAKPVGIMACNDVCGQEVLQACAAARLHVPDEVAAVGVDNDEMICELSNPPLSSIALDVERAGYEAARLLDQLISGQSTGGQVVWIKPTHVAVRRSSDVIAQDDPVVAKALKFIRQHEKQNVSVDHVTEDVGVSRRTLERRFYRSLGRTVLSEIRRCHLHRAKQLLLETNLPSYQIAVEAGFGSLKNFNRTFGLIEGATPGSFRRRSTSTLTPPRGKALPLAGPRAIRTPEKGQRAWPA